MNNMIQLNKLCAYDDDLQYELDELIEEFTRNNDRLWACRGILDRISIYMNIITYQKLSREIGYMPKEIARYKGFRIRIDNDLKNGQFMMKEDEIMKFEFGDLGIKVEGLGKHFAFMDDLVVREYEVRLHNLQYQADKLREELETTQEKWQKR